MEKIEDYMRLPYKIELVPDIEEGGYAVSCPELPGCLSCGDSLEEAMKNIEDAKREWMNVALVEGGTIPVPENLEDYSGQFKLRIPKSLHKQLAEHSKREGISMNQYCLYLLAMNDAHHVANWK